MGRTVLHSGLEGAAFPQTRDALDIVSHVYQRCTGTRPACPRAVAPPPPSTANAALSKLRTWLQSRKAGPGNQTLVVEWTQDVKRAQVPQPGVGCVHAAMHDFAHAQLSHIPTNLDVELDIQGPPLHNDPQGGEVASTVQWLLEVLFGVGGSTGGDKMDDTDDVAQLTASLVDFVREVGVN